MKFYDLEGLENLCGTDNKYEVPAKVAALARKLGDTCQIEKGTPRDERFISSVLADIENGTSEINAQKNE